MSAVHERLACRLREFRRWLHSGGPEADWTLLGMPDEWSHEAEPYEAALRIHARLKGPPLHWGQFTANLTALKRAGAALDPAHPLDPAATAWKIAQHNAWFAVREVIARVNLPEDDRLIPEYCHELLHCFQVVLQGLIVEEAWRMGPGWAPSREKQQRATEEEA